MCQGIYYSTTCDVFFPRNLEVVVIGGGDTVITDETMATSAPGIFAAGHILGNSPCQIDAAVGDGVIAAMSALNYVQKGSN